MLFVTFDWPIQNIVLLEQNYKYSCFVCLWALLLLTNKQYIKNKVL